ncbi:MAG TPA: helix-turn-helix transcriptional regulator, partial [Vicinamibacterales bacterium]|nr:helix-turn-helix transcriptional regulator [Vicinamibacterales bacterium]
MKRIPSTQAFDRARAAVAASAAEVDGDLPLSELAARTGLSPFHLHRVFSAATGETPKQYGLRIRLSQAGALLLTSGQSVLSVAMSCGFRSPEVFTRAFRRQFGMTPSAYRARGFSSPVAG